MLSGDEVYGDDVTSGLSERDFDIPIDPKRVESIDITPDYAATARWMAFMLAEHGYDNRSYGPVASLIEQIRFLSLNEPETVQKIIEELENHANKVTAGQAIHENGPKPIMVHYHEPAEKIFPPYCKYCSEEIEQIENGQWVTDSEKGSLVLSSVSCFECGERENHAPNCKYNTRNSLPNSL